MIRELFFFGMLTVAFLVGCSNQESVQKVSKIDPASIEPAEPVASEAFSTHPALDVANAILAAIHNGDANKIKAHFNEKNRQKSAKSNLSSW